MNRAPIDSHSPSPGEDAVVFATDITLNWSCTDPDGDDLTYDIYFGDSPNPSLVESGVVTNSYSLEAMERGQTYYWKVVAHDGRGGVSESPEWSFWINTPPVISLPDSEVDEGKVFRLDLREYAEDPDGDEIAFSLEEGSM